MNMVHEKIVTLIMENEWNKKVDTNMHKKQKIKKIGKRGQTKRHTEKAKRHKSPKNSQPIAGLRVRKCSLPSPMNVNHQNKRLITG